MNIKQSFYLFKKNQFLAIYYKVINKSEKMAIKAI